MIEQRKVNGLYHNMGYVAGKTIFTREEMERRQKLAREALKNAGADVLLVQQCFPSASMALDPYITWLTGTPGYRSTVTAVLPQDGDLELLHGGGMQAVPGKECPYLTGTEERLKQLLAGKKRIAYAGTGRMSRAFGEFLREEFPGADVTDFTEELDGMKAVKSREELDAVENAVWIQDKLIEAAVSYLRPGRTQAEIWADIIRMLAELNADLSVMPKILMASGKNGVVGSFPVTATGAMDDLSCPEYRLKEDDWVHIIYETPGQGGYYSETGRVFYFQEPCREAKVLWEKAVKLMEFETGCIRPGRNLREIQKKVCEYLEREGAQPDYNVFQIRGIGNLTTERPQLYEWDQMRLKPGMTLNLQPRYTDESGTAIILDTYLVTESGIPRRLSKVPQELIVL